MINLNTTILMFIKTMQSLTKFSSDCLQVPVESKMGLFT